MKRYKVWVKVSVEEIDEQEDTYIDVWEAPFPVPLFVSEDQQDAEAFAERYNDSIELFAIDNQPPLRVVG